MASKSKVYAMISQSTLLDLTQLGEGLKAARLRRNWKQEKVCQISGLSLSTLRRIETGDPHVPIGMYAHLCECYHLTGHWHQLVDTDRDLVAQAIDPPYQRQRARTKKSQRLDFDI